MKLASNQISVYCFTVLTLLTLAATRDAAGQVEEPKRKGGFGALFKGRPAREAAGHEQKLETIRTLVLDSIPEDRHYRQLLADSIAITYRNSKFKNLWNSRQMPDRLFQHLSQHLVRHGLPEILALDPNSFSGLPRRAPVNSRDLAYTIAIADAGLLVRLGAVPPSMLWANWDAGDRPGDDRCTPDAIAADMLRISSYRKFEAGAAIDTMASRNWIYRELQNGYIASLRARANASRFPQVPDPASTGLATPGQPYPYAGVLAENLAMRGHLNLPEEERRSLQSVTPALADAIKSFQREKGLAADGIMGSGTWKFLSINPAAELKKRTLNLHRARLLPDEFGKRYLIINLPSAELFAFEDGRHSFTMRVVYGKNDSPDFHTPVFRDIMKEVVFAPYWNVPESISTKEIYPKLVEDPTYLTTKEYEIVDTFNDNATVFELNEETMAKIATGELWLRQKPIAGNALGKVKFLLPNQFHIYLHDTPSKQFFSMSNRAQSHGCIRLADPPKMAEWTLRHQGWDPPRITAAMNAPAQTREPLKDPVNVYITYFTTFPRPSGTSAGEFVLAPARDVYKLDEKDAGTLAAVLP